MPTVPVIFKTFDGLNLRDDPLLVGSRQATDMLNASCSPGRIATRGGYIKFNQSTPAGTYQNVVETRAGGTKHMVGFRTTNLDKIDTLGAVTAAAAAFPANFRGFSSVDFGTPSGILLYVADSGSSSSGGTLQKWNGAVVANGSGKPAFVAGAPWGNRLAQGYYYAAADTPSAANGSKSTVFFSDAGLPDTYTSTSWIQLQPGDGEVITAMVTWRDSLFVFKESAVFVFYGTSTASDGTAVFNYRRVSLPSSILPFQGGPGIYAAYAGPDGVYYQAGDGIYVTTGDVPAMVSDITRTIFSGTALLSQALGGAAFASHLTCVAGKIYLAYTNANQAPRVLVLDRPSNAWELWSLTALSGSALATPINGSSVYSSLAGGLVPLFMDNATADFYVFSPQATDDDGTAISWSWKSGKYPLDEEARVSTTRESSLFGTGTVTLTVSSDRYADQSGSVSLGSVPTLGATPVPVEGWLQKDQEARYFQHTLSGSGPAVVEALTHYLATVKPAEAA